MTFTTPNMILSQLEPATILRLGEKLQRHEFRRGTILQELGASIQYVWFPETALITLAAENLSGESVIGSIVGWNGALGAFEACGSRISFAHSSVQFSGTGYRLRAEHYRELFDHSRALRTAVHQYVETLLVEARQLAACTALHTVESRMCRVLLDASERSHGGSVLSLTQEMLAHMLGVQRTTIAGAASTLQRNGMIRTVRGNVELLEMAALAKTACSCRQAIAYAIDQIYASREDACEA